jgi:lysophospholipase L1-like esterase
MEKSSVFATNIRPLLLSSYYALYGDLGDKGVQGRNGWIFYRPDIDYLVKPSVVDSRYHFYDPNDTPMRDSIIDTIVAFRDQLAAKGIDLLVVIMPGKPSIYPDLLNPSMANKSLEKFGPSQDIMVELKKRNVDVVDLFSALANERKRDGVAGDSIYLRTDTHFKSRGVLAVASAVAQSVNQYPWFENGDSEYIIDSVDVLRSGDIAEMTTPDTKLKCLKFSFAPEKTRCYQVYRISRDESGNELQRSLYKDDYQKSKVLVLGDSFSRIYQTDEPRSAGWISHLAKELRQPVASIVNDGGASTLVRKTLERKSSVLRGKKLVIWEIVERDFRYGADGWKNVKL